MSIVGRYFTLDIEGHAFEGKECRVVYYRDVAEDYLIQILDPGAKVGFMFVSEKNLKPFKFRIMEGETREFISD